MNNSRESSLPTGLILLVIYQWILALASLVFVFFIIPPCWGIAIGYASIGIVGDVSKASAVPA